MLQIKHENVIETVLSYAISRLICINHCTENSTSAEKPLTSLNLSEVEEIIVEGLSTVEAPSYWTDDMFDELISEGCEEVRKYYEPNLNHKNGYELAYRLILAETTYGCIKHLFSLLVEKNASEVERLVRSVYRPYYTFAIHVDKKV